MSETSAPVAQGAPSRPRLFLIDGMALLFRSFYAMGKAQLTSPEGEPIGAVFGFMRIVQKILKDHGATHFAVTWDLQGPTFRHDRFEHYKATRSEAPSELLAQIPTIKNVLEQCAVPCFSKAGFEGDDVLGTLAVRFTPFGDVFIVSSDKDFMQLVHDSVRIFSLKTGDDYVLIGEEGVREYFGVSPDKVRDVLAIMGDKVDNVPGVKGIGEKGAAKLVSEFGSIEELYANLDKVGNPRTRGLLETHRADAFLSKELVTIDTDVPLDMPDGALLDVLRYDWGRLCAESGARRAFTDLRMTSLLKALEGGGSPRAGAWPNVPARASASAALATDLFGNAIEGPGSAGGDAVGGMGAGAGAPARVLADWGGRRYESVLSRAKLDEVLARVSHPDTKAFAFDTETTGLDIIENHPIGVSLSFAEGQGYYIPAHEVHLTAGSVSGLAADADFQAEHVWDGLRRALAARKGTIVGHNLKFDAHQLCNRGVPLGDARVADTMVAAWLLDSSAGGYGLDAQTLKIFALEKIPTSRLIGKETGRKSMLEVPLGMISEYAAEDVDATLRLWNAFEPKLAEGNYPFLFWDMEMPLLRMLVDMERAGVHIDSDYLADLAVEAQDRMNDIERQVHALAGDSFNLGSPKQLGAVLFERLKVHETLGYKGKLAKTSLGYKTDVSVLETFAAHPVVSLVMEYRELSKLLGTYILTLPQLVKSSTGRIHTQFNQIGTATGRLSSNDPNLQNIPVRTPLGKRVRKAFCAATEGSCIISADYSQVELRVLAHLSGDPNMIDAFRRNADIHRETAAKILGKTPAEVTPEERGNAKTINFGIIYGMGAQRLAREQGIPLAEAKAFIEKYFMNFSRVRDFLDGQKAHAYEHGYVSTFFGRRRPVPLGRGLSPMDTRAMENVAINSPIQGTAADIMKLGMLRAHRALTEGSYRSRVLLQVHDELVLEGPSEEADEVERVVKDALQGAVDFSIPLLAEVSKGRNWLEAK